MDGFPAGLRRSVGFFFLGGGREVVCFITVSSFSPQQKVAAIHTQTFSPSLSPHSWGSGRSHKY